MTKPITRRELAIGLCLAPILRAAPTPVTVYKTKTCGCCGKWVEHMRANGFDVTVNEVESTAPSRKKYGVPDGLQSCHTGVAGGYSLEGHIPAEDIQRLLREKPKGRGLAVPGMPMGSPGMEGQRRNSYRVLLFQDDGTYTVFREYAGD